jgi:hypothetical protein
MIRKIPPGVAGAMAILATTATASSAFAQRAEVVPAERLPAEGPHHVLDIATLGEYAHVSDPSHVSGLANLGTLSLHSRLALGHLPAYCAGLDAEIGGSDAGLAYGATAYPVGLGTIWGRGDAIALCGGAGLDRVGDAVPLAARFPAELSVALDVGSVRPTLWVRPSWVAGAAARRHGASASFVDELEAGLLVRLSPQYAYWSTTSAGGGLAIGVKYWEFMGTRAVGLSLGFDFEGAQ